MNKRIVKKISPKKIEPSDTPRKPNLVISIIKKKGLILLID